MKSHKSFLAILILILAIVGYITNLTADNINRSYESNKVTIESDENVYEKEQISSVLNQFFKAIRERDKDNIQAVLDESITVIEASIINSKVKVIKSDAYRDILPPPGNDDWEKASISNISITISPSHPSVSMVAFTIKFPMEEIDLKGLQEIPPEILESLNSQQRENIEQSIKEKSLIASMFALMAKRQNIWKIMSITLPK